MDTMNASKKYKIFKKCNCKCHYCGDDIIKMINDGLFPTLDHKIPRFEQGSNDYDNLVLACSFCNSSKGTRNESEMKRYIEPYIEGLCEKRDLRLFHNQI